MDDKLKSFEDELNKIDEQIKSLEEKQKPFIAEVESLTQQFQEARKKGDTELIQKLRRQVAVPDAQIDAINDEIKELQAKRKAVEKELSIYKWELEDAQRKAERLAREQAQAEKERQAHKIVQQRLNITSAPKPAPVVQPTPKVQPVQSASKPVTKFADKLHDALSAQINPTRNRVELNDKVTKNYFNLDKKSYYYAVTHPKAKRLIREKVNHKKYGTVVTPTSISNIGDYSNVEPLTEFDRAVLAAIISEQCEGNPYTTPAIIFRALVGKAGEPGVTPCKNQEAAILQSIEKLMFTQFNAETAKSFDQLKYPNGDEIQVCKSAILPACIVNAKINGQQLDNVIYFDRESPFYMIAEAKNQIVRYDSRLLDVPNQNNTPLYIMLKNYVIRRICEIKLHTQLIPTLTFDDVLAKCRITNADNKTKMRLRQYMEKFFQHLQDCGFIDSFTVRKSGKGNSYHGISFTYHLEQNIENVEKSDNDTNQTSNKINSGSSGIGCSNSATGYSNSATGYSNSATGYSNSATQVISRKSKNRKARRRNSRR